MDALAQRWGVPPSVVLSEDTGLVLGILKQATQSAEPSLPSPDDAMKASILERYG